MKLADSIKNGSTKQNGTIPFDENLPSMRRNIVETGARV
jgi:hypothetical protein